MKLFWRLVFVIVMTVGYFYVNINLQLLGVFLFSLSILYSDFRNFKVNRFDISTTFVLLLVFISISHFIFFSGLSAYSARIMKFYFYNKIDLGNQAIYIFNLGSVVIILAMRIFIKNETWNTKRIDNTSQRSLLIFSIFSFIASVFFDNFLTSVGTIGTFFTYSVNGSLLLLSYLAYKQKRGIWAVFLYTIFLSTYALAFSYLRMAILIPWVAFCTGDLLAKKSILKLGIYTRVVLISGLFVFPILFSFLGASRNKIIGQDKITQSLELFTEEDELSSFEGQQTIVDRFTIVNQLSNIITLTRKKGFYNGQTLNYLGFVFIPRFLWPEKPLIKQGQWFALEIGNARKIKNSDKANNSINMTVPGEFYLNFSWLGLLIGCFIFGYFISWIWNQTTFENLLGWIFRFYLIFLGLFSLGSDLQIVPSLISYVVIYKAIDFFNKVSSEKPRMKTSTYLSK